MQVATPEANTQSPQDAYAWQRPAGFGKAWSHLFRALGFLQPKVSEAYWQLRDLEVTSGLGFPEC